jgi:pimeloyl-ACP methyl ester carboxylesterase
MASTASFHARNGVRKRDGNTQGGLGMSTFVLIHGAGDVGWYWHLVEAALRERGHDAVAPDLPCDDDAAGLPEYTNAVVEAVGDRIDLVVVAQSLGGFTAPLVCERVPVKLLVMVAPMIPAPGEVPADYWANTRYEEEVQERYEDDIALFYQDVPPELASEALKRSRGSPRSGWGSHRLLRRGPTSPRGCCSAATTACSPPRSSATRRESAWGSLPTRSMAANTPALSRPKELAERLEAYAAEASVNAG